MTAMQRPATAPLQSSVRLSVSRQRQRQQCSMAPSVAACVLTIAAGSSTAMAAIPIHMARGAVAMRMRLDVWQRRSDRDGEKSRAETGSAAQHSAVQSQ